MNIIEAWKAAKEGQRIKSNSTWTLGIKKCEGDLLMHVLRGCSTDEALLTDDWEVVKEKKSAKFEYKQIMSIVRLDQIPGDAKVTIEWEE